MPTIGRVFGIQKLGSPRGSCFVIRLGRYEWSTFDWGLSREQKSVGPQTSARIFSGMFALRCASCHDFTFGCGDHWFCGICRVCQARLERE